MLDRALPALIAGTAPRDAARPLRWAAISAAANPRTGASTGRLPAVRVHNLRARRRAALSRRVHRHRRRATFVYSAHAWRGAASLKSPHGRGFMSAIMRVFAACGDGARARNPRHGTRRQTVYGGDIPARAVGRQSHQPRDRIRMKKILILGVNGFIGHHLSQAHPRDDRLGSLRHGHADRARRGPAQAPALPFLRRRHHDQQGMDRVPHKKCDMVLPLVAIATPATYVKRAAARVRARLRSQPADRALVRASTRSASCFRRRPKSTACAATANSIPKHSELVLGPINKPRWIYACAKQLMDRVIWALRHGGGLELHAVPPVQLDRRRARLASTRRRKAARA